MLRQDKGRGVVDIDQKKYAEKSMDMLNTKQFHKLDKDPTKTFETKVQRAVRKINIEYSILVDQHQENCMEKPKNIKSQ